MSVTTTLLFASIFVMIVVTASRLIVGTMERLSSSDAWASAASELGLEFSEDDRVIEGKCDGIYVQVEFTRHRSGRSEILRTNITARVRGFPEEIEIVPSGHSALSDRGTTWGLIPPQDRTFARRFEARAADLRQGVEFLQQSSTMSVLSDLRDRGYTPMIRHRALEFRFLDWILDVPKLTTSVRDLAAAAKQLEASLSNRRDDTAPGKESNAGEW